MPVITQSFPCKQGDPFNNVTVTVYDDHVGIVVNEYTRHGEIVMTREEAYRFAQTILADLAKGQ